MIDKNKISEAETVKRFLNHARVDFEEKEIDYYPPEPADIWCKDIDKKFQIVKADFDFQKKIHTQSIVIGSDSRQSVFKKFIIDPIEKKRKYSKEAKGITLLINSWIEPPWVKGQVDLIKKVNSNYFKSLGFDEIYLVCPQKNISIFP